MVETFASFIRKLVGPVVFRKRLPADFGKQRIFVTARSDMRLLAPGFQWAGGDLLDVIRAYVGEGQVVWDIGSNLGIFAFAAARRVGPSGEVYSLEADPRYADIQGRTVRMLRGESAPVTVLSAAVADRIGLLDLVIPKKGHTQNHLKTVAGNSPGEAEASKQVVTLTLDFLLDYWRVPNFVKIDVEGAEVLAIQGAHRLFTEIRPMAYIECSPLNSEQLTVFFRARNYSLFRLESGGREVPIESFAFNTLVKPN